MRFSLATMSCAVALALLAGCSSSQNSATLPSSGIGAQAQQGAGANAVHGKITPMKLLELQAAGKMPGFAPRKAMERMLKYYQGHPHQQFRAHHTGAGVAIWATNPEYGYLIGMNKSGKKVLTYTYTGDYGAYDPITVKVDHSKNAWVANEDNSSDQGGAVQEYGSSGSYMNSYSFDSYCPSEYAYCYGYGLDSAENSTNVFAGSPYFYYDYCGTYTCSSDEGSGIYKFNSGSPSGGSTFYLFSDKNEDLNCTVFSNYDASCDEVYYMDVDSSGNVWFDFYNEFYGAGLAELTSSGSYNIIFSAGTYGFPGSVYVSSGGTVLNVTDQDSRMTYQYHLPVTSSSSSFASFGPTATNVEGEGDPIGGGMNATDTQMIFGDEGGWLDRCTISANKCKAVATINLPDGSSGAAFSPSDK
jgi:hypothetical protein